MPTSLRKAWRVLATALAFGSFGVGGLMLSLLYFPLLVLVLRDPRRRTLHARATVQWVFTCFVALMRRLGLITYEIHGADRLARRGLLVLANHPTLIDVVFLISLIGNADCVVKASLADNPFTWGAVRATGYIRNNSGAALLQACIVSLREGGNLIVFPEGTRSRPGEPLQMQRGAAQIAVRARGDITPVTIRCEPLGLSKGRPWWKVAAVPLHFTIRVGEDITIAPFLERSAHEPALAARHLTAYLLDYFSEGRGGHARTRA